MIYPISKLSIKLMLVAVGCASRRSESGVENTFVLFILIYRLDARAVTITIWALDAVLRCVFAGSARLRGSNDAISDHRFMIFRNHLYSNDRRC